MDEIITTACIDRCEQSLIMAIYAHVQATPDSIAIESSGETLSYARVWELVLNAATKIETHNVTPGDAVGVLTSYSIEGIVASLAILHVGCVYVPLSRHTPIERLVHQLSTSDVRLILEDSDIDHDASWADTLNVPVVHIEPKRSTRKLSPTGNSGKREAADPAYIIFTSGTSGPPKPVVGNHNNLVSHANAFIDRFNLSSNDRVFQVAARTFDVSIEEIMPTFYVGATLVIGSDPRNTDIDTLNTTFLGARITVLNLPTSLWLLWINYLQDSNQQLSPLIRQVLIGSETCPVSALDTWFAVRHSNVRCTNCYGLTETTITNFAWDLEPAASGKPYRTVPIGSPLNNVIARIETDGKCTEFEQRGELLLGGECVTNGYRQESKQTKGRFVTRQLSSGRTARFFRTGDFAIKTLAGYTELAGRIDRQVKIRGYRVEPDYIEHRLSQWPGVLQCAVRVSSSYERPVLIAYVKFANECAPSNACQVTNRTSETMQSFFKYVDSQLLAHEVPTKFYALLQFPLRENGKVDYERLADSELKHFSASVDDNDPWMSCVATVLGGYPESEELSFIECGGDSICASRLVSLLRQKGFGISLTALLDRKSLSQLRGDLLPVDSGSTDKPGFLTGLTLSKNELLKLRACRNLWDNAEWIASMSKMQIGMVLHSSNSPTQGFCIEHVEGQLDNLDTDAFKKAWNIVIARHGMLRTRFYFYLNDKPVQVCSKLAEIEWQEHDFRHSREPATKIVRQYLERDRVQDFRFADELPYRLHLLKFDSGKHQFIWTYHHAILDGWSDTMLLDQVFCEYKSLVDEQQQECPRVGEYRDYIHYLQKWEGSEALSYWAEYLKGINTAKPWLLGVPAPANELSRMSTVCKELDPALCRKIAQHSSGLGVTPSCYFSALLGETVGATKNVEEVVLGTFISTRPAEITNADRTAGLFLNLVPLRIPRRTSNADTWLKTLFKHQLERTGKCELTIEEIQGQANPVLQEMFDILFVYENYPVSKNAEVNGMKNHPQSSFPVNFYIWPGEKTMIEVQFDQGYVDNEVVNQLINAYVRGLERGVCEHVLDGVAMDSQNFSNIQVESCNVK